MPKLTPDTETDDIVPLQVVQINVKPPSFVPVFLTYYKYKLLINALRGINAGGVSAHEGCVELWGNDVMWSKIGQGPIKLLVLFVITEIGSAPDSFKTIQNTVE